MTEAEWDPVIRVHLKGHAAPTRHAAEYWRTAAKVGNSVRGSIINTTSVAGFIGSFGQANYAAAKLGVVALAYTASLELEKYGIRANSVSPSARTRLTQSVPSGREAYLSHGGDDSDFDRFDPANVSPLIAWLAAENCPANRQVFHIDGNRLFVVAIPTIQHRLETVGRWTLEALDAQLPPRLVPPLPEDAWQ